jgi:hypothetical protein
VLQGERGPERALELFAQADAEAEAYAAFESSHDLDDYERRLGAEALDVEAVAKNSRLATPRLNARG